MRSLRQYFELLNPRRRSTKAQSRSPRLEGSLIVSDTLVTQLEPLGHNHTGITKAGRLSFRGHIGDQAVKIYSCHSIDQIKLRIAIQKHSFSTLYFPEILAYDNLFIVERWIEGDNARKYDTTSISVKLDIFFNELQQDGDLLRLALNHQHSFCYLDFLISRLSNWSHVTSIGNIVFATVDFFEKHKTKIPVRITHPDVTLSNLIIASNTDKLYLVDNELLGSGRGWILDRMNAQIPLPNVRLTPNGSTAQQYLVSMFWNLRLLASALNSGEFEKANYILNASSFAAQASKASQNHTSELVNQFYTEANASKYEDRRSINMKWAFEERTFRSLIEQVRSKIENVLDAPIGTGRFLSFYLSFLPPKSIIGLDFSADMLAQCRKKEGGSSIILVQHDILSSSPPFEADLVVCFRFLNLFCSETTSVLIDNLIQSARKFILISVRLLDHSMNITQPIEGKIYIHQREWFVSHFAKHSFVIDAEETYTDHRPGRYYVWLLRKQN